MPLKHKPLKLPLSAFSPQAAPIEPSNKATLDGHVDLDGLSKDLDFQAWEGKGRSISGGVAFSRSATLPSVAAPLVTVRQLHQIPFKGESLSPAAVVDFEVVKQGAWDDIERCLDQVVGIVREVEETDQMEVDGGSGDAPPVERKTVVLSNLLPPPLPSNIPSPALLPQTADYQAFSQQISALSLIPNLCLKFLPPSIVGDADNVGWWEDEETLIAVLSAYLIPCLDSFGSHRLIFGASPTPVEGSTSAIFDARRDWHSLVLKVLTSIKLDAVSVGDLMGGTAARVYNLEGVCEKK